MASRPWPRARLWDLSSPTAVSFTRRHHLRNCCRQRRSEIQLGRAAAMIAITRQMVCATTGTQITACMARTVRTVAHEHLQPLRHHCCHPRRLYSRTVTIPTIPTARTRTTPMRTTPMRTIRTVLRHPSVRTTAIRQTTIAHRPDTFALIAIAYFGTIA